MKRKPTFGKLGIGFALALAGLAGTTQPATIVKQNTHQEQQKATAKKVVANHHVVRENVGGLDLVQHGEYGMSPKEYGIRFGNGKSRKAKTNYNRLSHNAKIERRA